VAQPLVSEQAKRGGLVQREGLNKGGETLRGVGGRRSGGGDVRGVGVEGREWKGGTVSEGRNVPS